MLENHQLTDQAALIFAHRHMAQEAATTGQSEVWPEQPASLPQSPGVGTTTVGEALCSDDRLLRASAQQLLADVTRTLNTVADRKQKVDLMMTQLLRETRDMRRRQRQRIVSKVAVALLLIAALLYTNGHFFFNFWWVFLGGGGAIAADERVNKRREAVQALYTAGEPRAVGVLAIALRDGDYPVQRVAEQALHALLPRVRASDAAYIDNEQMAALIALIDRYPINTHMQRAVLKALEQIGDERAIPAVENLAAMGPTADIRNQANACLPFLLERVRLAHEHATLLRGSASPAVAAAPAQLLRPASGAETTPAEQLLRPTQNS